MTMIHKEIPFSHFRFFARQAVLDAIDKYMKELTGCDYTSGWEHSDLPELFQALDPHIEKLARRFDLESNEFGSVSLTIFFD